MLLRLLIMIILAALAAFGQAAPAPLKIGDVIVQGSFRSRVEMWDWFDTGDQGQYAFSGNLFKLSFSQQQKKFDWYFELAAPFLLGLPADASLPAPQGLLGLGGNYWSANNKVQNAGMVFPKQGYLRFKGLFGDETQSLRIGRFEFSDGAETTPKSATLALIKRDRVSQRLIGPFGWSHAGRSFDGAQYVANGKKLNFTLVGALPTRGAFQVDGWGELKVGFGYASLNGSVNRKRNTGDWRVFAIYYQDWRHIVKTDNRPAAIRNLDLQNIRIGSFGGHYLHATETAAGTFDLMLWGVLQNGRWGTQDHGAMAGDVEAGWQPKFAKRLKPWIRGGYYRGTGDSDPLDKKHGTFFELLPTPRPFARFPFYNLMNNQDAFGGLTLRPHKAWTLRSDYRVLSLSNRHDQWLLGGGAFQPWTFGYIGRPSGGAQSFANLWDISADWNINAHYALAGYFGHSPSKSVIRNIYPGSTSGNFGYIEFNYRF